MNSIVLDFPYFSLFWSSKAPISNVVENVAENWGSLFPVKIGEGQDMR